MAYATVDDLEARWRYLGTEEQARASALLNDAAVLLDSLVIVDPTDEHQADVLRVVSCSMVQRSMVAATSDAFGVSQATMTAGPYSQNMSFANPSGDLYLTGTEKQMLGIGAPYIGTIRAESRWCR